MNWIEERLVRFIDQTACIEGKRSWLYGDLQKYVERLIKTLRSCGNQSVVAIRASQTIEGIAALLAIHQLNLIALPLGPGLSPNDCFESMKVAAADYHLSFDRGVAKLKEREPCKRPTLYKKLSGSGLVLLSSGTSGSPKAMLHSLKALLDRYKDIPSRTERSLQLLLLDHIGGFDAAFRSLFAGSTLIIPDQLNPEAVGRAIEAHKVTVLPTSPTFLNLLLLNGIPHRYDCSCLKIIAYGAEPMPSALLKRLTHLFPQAKLQQKFGTSETGAIQIRSVSSDSLFFSIQDMDTKWKIIDNELWLKSPSRIIGYLNDESSSLGENGWYQTGDLVSTNNKGQLQIIGRKSALINVGGQKVHPAEIEAIIEQIAEVDACRVYAEAGAITGSIIACKITTQSADDLRTWKRRLRKHCRPYLAAWKIPSQLELTDSISVTNRLKRT